MDKIDLQITDLKTLQKIFDEEIAAGLTREDAVFRAIRRIEEIEVPESFGLGSPAAITTGKANRMFKLATQEYVRSLWDRAKEPKQ